MTEILQDLQQAGTAQNRKVYAEYGVQGSMYGVGYADLVGLKKKIKMNHRLALQLWQTGNHEARLLACMIADPGQVDEKLADAWCRQAKNCLLTDVLAKLLFQTKSAGAKMLKWLHSSDEWIGRIGYRLAALHATENERMPEQIFINILHSIEKEIHHQPNRKREAMHAALIAIGNRNRHLQFLAEQAAERIGPVHLDHGDVSLKIPKAIPNITKAWE